MVVDAVTGMFASKSSDDLRAELAAKRDAAKAAGIVAAETGKTADENAAFDLARQVTRLEWKVDAAVKSEMTQREAEAKSKAKAERDAAQAKLDAILARIASMPKYAEERAVANAEIYQRLARIVDEVITRCDQHAADLREAEALSSRLGVPLPDMDAGWTLPAIVRHTQRANRRWDLKNDYPHRRASYIADFVTALRSDIALAERLYDEKVPTP